MGFFNFFGGGTDINEGVQQYKLTANAFLLDVRTKNEYFGGHVPEAVNIPLSDLANSSDLPADKQTPIFTYCLSGARSAQASSLLKQMGYTNVNNIGGINSYRGQMER